MKLNGTAALVTGGASGLGETTARLLAKGGARVTVIDLDEDAAKAVANSIGGQGFKADIANEAEVLSAIEAAEAAHGPARIIVNCAGIGGGAQRTVSRDGAYPLDRFQRIVETNLVGTFNVIRLAAAAMAKADAIDEERGVIINTASVAAFDGQIGQVAYSASKAGIVGMTLPIARDLSKMQVRVNTIAPGLFLTPMLKRLDEETQARLGSQVPHPSRLGRPEEFASLAIQMIENPMLNGETVRLDGAIRMAPK